MRRANLLKVLATSKDFLDLSCLVSSTLLDHPATNIPVLRIRIRDQVPFWPLGPDPGSGIGFSGSRIPNPYFWELSDNFGVKSSIILWKLAQIFFLQHFKNKIIFNFVKFVAAKKIWQQIFFHTSLLLLFLDPGSGINIPDPQHCRQESMTSF